MREDCEKLLKSWCESLLELQIREIKDPTLKGGILCPACGRIHGRCFDAIYPFLYLADIENDDRFLEAAILLFEWAQNTVSREDGSYVNDENSDWKGTTVFSVIQMIEALTRHGHILEKNIYEIWKERVRKSADFLYQFDEFEVCNVNYRITNSLAMELCAEFFNEKRYRIRGEYLAVLAEKQLTEEGLLFGEGRPTAGISLRGCRSVDIGYNLEESVPALIQYSDKAGNRKLKKRACQAMKYHLRFFLDDGGIDNSFGTRNYKWTYWGSRTSDGCLLGCLLAAEEMPDLGIAAYKNFFLLKACTYDGILYGGPHIRQIGEFPCIHHTFTHAKVLAEILDEKLENRMKDGVLPRMEVRHTEYLKELDTCLISEEDYTATVTAYDWEYTKLPGGHASGGTLSLLWHKHAGLALCASMSCYQMREAANMQMPRFSLHKCLTPRLEWNDTTKVYTNLYDDSCTWSHKTEEKGTIIDIVGCLTDFQKNQMQNGMYLIRYYFQKNVIYFDINVDQMISSGVRWIIPIISGHEEAVAVGKNCISIQKTKCKVLLMVRKGNLKLPYGEKRIYNLVPGVEALQTDIATEKGKIAFYLTFCYD